MGDRTSLQMRVITSDAGLRSKAREVFEEYSGGDFFLDDWNDGGPPSGNVWAVSCGEASCGNAYELVCALNRLIAEEGQDLAYLVWEDPKYDWLGDVHIHVPGMEHDHRGNCDSDGNTLLTQTDIAGLIDKAKSGQDLTASLLKVSGADHYVAFGDLGRAPA